MEKKINKKGVVQEYRFSENVLVHRNIHDPENWYLTAKYYGFERHSLCTIKSNEQGITTETWRALSTRRQQLNQDIKDISEFIETPF